jgi:putative spermidine/putrescine transport system permease protein
MMRPGPVLTVGGIAVIAFILAPLVVIVGASFTTTSYIVFPPVGFTLDWYAKLLVRRDFYSSFWDSLIVALACTAIAVPAGALAAIGLHRASPATRVSLQSFIMSPLVLPTIITGVALLQFYQMVDFHFPVMGLILGHVIITIPYALRSVGAGLMGLDPALEEAAASLGATPLRILLRVLLPNLAPALLVSVIFVFIISFDQVTVSIFLSGADVMPLPIRIYSYIEFSLDPMVAAISTVLIVFAYVLVWVLERSFGLNRAFGSSH